MANNYKMDNGSRLLKMGIEAFGMLEEEYGRRGRPAAAPRQKAPARPAAARQPDPPKPDCVYQYQPQQPLAYQMMNPVSSSEEMITSYDAMKLHDGLIIMDFPKRKSAAMAY